MSEGVSPVAPWVGGKRNLASRIIPRLESIPHQTYAEPFVGMGGIFLRRKPVKAEIINDLNRDVATLFRILQRHYVAFLDTLRFQLTTRTEFERLTKTNPDTLTDLERAARFLYLQRTAFGGKPSGQNFGTHVLSSARFDLTKLVPMLEAAHERLAGVTIECLPYADFITRYDRPATLFYLDPPYFGAEHYYGRDYFGRDDFERLAEVLKDLKGRFVMSLNDHPEVRRLFGSFAIETIPTTYTIQSGGNATQEFELLISGGGG